LNVIDPAGCIDHHVPAGIVLREGDELRDVDAKIPVDNVFLAKIVNNGSFVITFANEFIVNPWSVSIQLSVP